MYKMLKFLLSSSIASLALVVANISTQPASMFIWYQPEVPAQLRDK